MRTISGKLPMKLPLNCTMELSSSMMVTVAVAGDPRVAPPVGFSRRTWNDSLPSAMLSEVIGTVMVAEVLPAPKVRMPRVGAKSPSLPPTAVPSTVVNSTTTPPAVPPVRTTVSIALRTFSLTM